MCASQKVLVLSFHWLSFPADYQTRFPAVACLEGKGSPIRTLKRAGPLWGILSGPFTCHVSSQAISSLALYTAVLTKEEVFHGSTGFSCCRAFVPHTEDGPASAQSPQWLCREGVLTVSENRSLGPRKSCYLNTVPRNGAFNILSLFHHLWNGDKDICSGADYKVARVIGHLINGSSCCYFILNTSLK